MDNIIKNFKTVWDLPFAKEVLLICLTAIFTHFFDMHKFRKKRRSKYKDKISEDIATALTAVRKVVLSTKTIEIYQCSIDNSPADSTNAIRKALYYPSFMDSMDTLSEMCGLVSEARGKYEPYLDLMSAAYLYVFERYLMNLCLYVGKNGFQEGLDILGLAVIVDIQKWENRFDQHLVNRINCPHYRFFSRHGLLWKLVKRYVEKKYLINTELNELMRISAEVVEDERKEEYI